MSSILKSLELSNTTSEPIRITLDKGTKQTEEDIKNQIDINRITFFGEDEAGLSEWNRSIKANLYNEYNLSIEVESEEICISLNIEEDKFSKVYMITENDGIEEKLDIYDLYRLILLTGVKEELTEMWEYWFDNIGLLVGEERGVTHELDRIVFYFDL